MSMLFALFLAGYGLLHPVVVDPASRSWLASGLGVSGGMLDATVCALTGLVIVGYLLAAASVAGILVPRRWWRPLVIAASVASAIMLVVCFTPWALPFLAIDTVLLWATLVRAGQPTPSFGH